MLNIKSMKFNIFISIFFCFCLENNSGDEKIVYLVEDCTKIVKEAVNEKISDFSIIPCYDTASVIKKTCDFFSNLTTSRMQLHSTCSTSEVLTSFLDKMGIHYELKYEERCFDYKYQNRKVLIGDKMNNYLLTFIKNTVVYFRLRSFVLLIDQFTGISLFEIQKTFSEIKVGVSIFFVERKATLTEKLKTSHKFNNFIVACGLANLKNVIKHAKDEGLFVFPYFWLIITEKKEEVEMFMRSNNITNTFNTTVIESMHSGYEKSINHLSVETTINLEKIGNERDSLIQMCISRNFSSRTNLSTTYLTNSQMESWKKNIGYTFYEFQVKCGALQRTHGMNGELFRQLGNWTFLDKFSEMKPYQTVTEITLENCNFSVLVGHFPPYVVVHWNEDKPGPPRITGLDVDVFNNIAKHLKFGYTMEVYNESIIGVMSNGTWSGLIGQFLENEEFDFILPSMIRTPKRSDALDFSVRLQAGSAVVLINTPKALEETDDFIRPFDQEVWFTLLCSISVATLCLTLTFHLSPYAFRYWQHNIQNNSNEHPHFKWWDSLFSMCSAFLQQGVTTPPSYVSGRIIFAAFCSTSLLVMQSYSSLLISFLTVNVPRQPFGTLEQLANNKYYCISTLNASGYLELLETSTDEILKTVWKKIQSNPDKNLVGSYAEGIQKITTEKRALIIDKITAHFLLKSNCSFTIAMQDILTTYNAFGARKKFPYLPAISTSLNYLRETGTIRRLYNQYITSGRSQCREEKRPSEIDVKNILVAIYLLSAGIIIAVITFGGEIIIEKYFTRFGFKSSTGTQKRQEFADANFKSQQTNKRKHTYIIRRRDVEKN